MPELYDSFQALDVGEFSEKLQRVYGRREELAERIRAAHTEVKRQSEMIPHTIRELISGGDESAGSQPRKGNGAS